MDLNDIWQEHKVWILGVLGGIVVFLIAKGFISSQYDTSGFTRRIGSAKAKLRRNSFYTVRERREATKDEKALEDRLGTVEGKTYFAMRKPFDLAGKGDPTVHYLATTTDVKNRVAEAMDDASVDFSQRQLGLPSISPTDRQDTQRTLVALDLIDDVLQRLLEASDQVLENNPESLGLRALDQIQIDIGAKARRRPRSRKKKQVDLGDRVGVKVRFHADSVTLRVFLESLIAADKRKLLLGDVLAKTSDTPGEPMSVTCQFLALMKKPS